MKTKNKIIAFSIILGLSSWLMDALVDFFTFHKRTILEALILDIPLHEFYMRTVILVSFTIFGIIISGIISKIKRSEEMLSESEEIYRTLFEKTINPVLAIDTEGNYIEGNQAALEFLECSRDELLMKNIRDFIPPGKEIQVIEEHKPLWDRGGTAETEYYINGKYKYLELIIIPVIWNKKRVIFCVGKDITYRKQVEEALRISEERMKFAIDGSNESVWDWNVVSREIFVTPSWEKISGYESGKIKFDFNWWKQSIHPDSIPVFEEALKAYLEGRKSLYELRYQLRTKSGEWKWIWTCGKCVEWDEHNKPLRIVGTHKDITEQVRAEDELRESKEKLTGIMASVTDHMSMIDEQYNIVWANNVAKRLFSPDLVGKKCYTAYHRYSKPCKPCAVKRCFENGKVHEHEREVIGVDGNPMIFWCTASPAERHQDGRPKMVVEISRNVTERKQAEREIRHLSRRLIEGMEEERKRLARDLHDELSEVLTAVYFGMESLHNSIPVKQEDQRKKCMELIGQIEEIGDRIRNISSDLRPAMLDDIGFIPTMKWYISDFVNRRQGIEIDLETIGIKKRLDPEIEIVLYRILQEGLNNIAKHAKANHVKVLLTHNHPKVIFSIKDNGVGFEIRKGILVSGSKSYGIGLAGLRERVASTGGTIDIRSRKGKGTLIRAELPIPEGKN